MTSGQQNRYKIEAENCHKQENSKSQEEDTSSYLIQQLNVYDERQKNPLLQYSLKPDLMCPEYNTSTIW